MAWEGLDRRKFPRAEYPCRITVKQKDNAEVLAVTTQNVSCGGICVSMPKNFGLYSTVELELDLLDTQDPIHCDGTIVWCVAGGESTKSQSHVYDTGIEFMELSETDSARIKTVIDQCLHKEQL